MDEFESNPHTINMAQPFIDDHLGNLKRKLRQLKIISIMFFLLALSLIVLLACAIMLGFGCTSKAKTAANKATPSPLKFLHVSDMHLDLYFNQSTSTKTFCRSIPNTLNNTPTDAAFEAPFGRIGCDSPHALIQSSLEFMNSISTDPNKINLFVLSGDQVAHRMEKGFVNGTVLERVLNTLNASSQIIKNVFPTTPVLPSMGNNDLPGDYVLPKSDSFYKSLLEIWKPLIVCSKCTLKVTTEEELTKTFLVGGYYKAELKDEKLVFLQLNTNYWTTKCIKLNPGARTLQIADAQLEWLKEQLKDAQTSGKRVIITGHILPGIDGYYLGAHESFWPKNYTQMYIELVTKTYKDIVIGQLFGHIHKDEIRSQRMNDNAAKKEDFSSFLLTAPGITPVYRNNPGFRVVSFDTNKRLLTDYEQYYMDIVLSTQNKKPIWMYDYSFGDKYLQHIPKDKRVITGKVVADVVDSFINATNMNSNWHTYIRHRQVNYQTDPYNRYVVYCVAKYSMKDEFDQCVKRYPVTGG